MAEITAAMVKDLREKSGAGMMDCKKALTETGGDMDAAMDWLRTKGLAAAAKKSSRTAAEGLVGVAVAGTEGCGGRGQFRDRFRRQERPVPGLRPRSDADRAASRATIVDAIKAATMPAGKTVEEALTNNIATIGENQSLRRAKRLEVSQGRGGPLRPQPAAPGPRQDRRARRARERTPAPTCSNRWASRSRCTSPRPSRWRSTRAASTRT